MKTPIGTIANNENAEVCLDRTHLHNGHQVVVGPSGMGKSRLILQIALAYILNLISTTLLDPRKKTAIDLISQVCEYGSKAVQQRLNVLNANQGNFSLDLLKPRMLPNGRQNWNFTLGRISLLIKAMMNLNFIPDKAIQLRRFKLVAMVLVFMATRVKGKFLELHEYHQATDFCNAHRRLLDARLPLMPPKYREDWKQFTNQSHYQMSQQIESTVNLLWSFTPPRVCDMLANDRPGVDFTQLYQSGEHLIAFGQADANSLTEDELLVFFAIIRTLVVHATGETLRPKRIIIEEAQLITGHDTEFILETARKTNTDVTLVFPGFPAMKNDHLDLTNVIMTNCATKFFFGTDDVESREYIRKCVLPSVINLKRSKRLQQFHDGYRRVTTPKETVAVTEGNQWSDKVDLSQTNTHGRGSGVDVSSGEDYSEGEDQRQSDSSGWSGENRSVGSGSARGRSQRRGRKQGRSYKQNQTDSHGHGVTRGRQAGGNRQTTVTRTTEVQWLSKYKTLEFIEGWEITKDMQEAGLDRLVSLMPPQTCLVKAGSFPAVVTKIYDVPDPFEFNKSLGRRLTKQMVERLWQRKEWFGPPSPNVTNGSSTSSSTTPPPSNKSKSKSASLASRLRGGGAKKSNPEEPSE